ncbi:MAG: anion permease [Verrucomicrobiales bacterium]|nr:anion permease [Verrucomicrobiales bacterium]
MEAWIVIGLLVAAVAMFASEKLPVDVVTLLLLCALILTGILDPTEAFAGFASGIVVMLASIFVIGAAMRDSGVLDAISRGLSRTFGHSEGWLTGVMMAGVSLLSAFMNNTTVTAMFVGPMVKLARQMKISPSRLLMPLAFASILGGTCTLIGTSTNVAVAGYVKDRGLGEFGMFEFAGVGLCIVAAGIAYMLLVGRRLLPDHSEMEETLAAREYLAEVVILKESPLVGQEVFDSDFSVLGFQVLKVLREGLELEPQASLLFQAGDRVMVAGKVDNLIKIKKIEGLDIVEDARLKRAGGDGAKEAGKAHIAEVVVTPRSRLVGRTLKETNFRQTSGLSVLAMMRGAQSVVSKIGETPLKAGDLLLVQGLYERMRRFEDDSELVIVSDHPAHEAGLGRGLLVLGLFGVAILVSSLGWVSVPVAMLMVALAAVLVRCVSMETAYENIDWRLLILIAGMTAFGRAMTDSGAADMVAGAVVGLLEPVGPRAVLAGFAVLSMVLTQQMSNAAAALVILPVALQAAATMGLNERTFALTVMLSASVAVVTPFEPSCLLVYGPGKYRFRDFFKVGFGLAVISLILILTLVPIYWPLEGTR